MPQVQLRRDYASAFAPGSSARIRKIVGDYILGKTLGAGSMGKVKVAVHRKTGHKVAVKIIPRYLNEEEANNTSVEDLESRRIRVMREAAVLQLLKHPNVVRLYDLIIQPRHYYLFFEYVSGGQMLDYIISHGRLKENVARKFLRQIVSALDYCHQNSIVHRDLKIENILITNTGNIKLIDFGLANLYSPRSHLMTFCGSLYFAAPELLEARPYIGPEVDIWSLGVVFYVLVCGKVPFDDQNVPLLHARIRKGQMELPDHLSPDCKHLLSRMLVVNPRERATLTEIRSHRWLNRGFTQLVSARMPNRVPLELPLDPQVIRRMAAIQLGTAKEISQHLENVVSIWIARRRLAKELIWRFRLDSNPALIRLGDTLATTDAVREAAKKSQVSIFGKALLFELQDQEEHNRDEAEEERDPMVSMYYLCREKIERESLGMETIEADFEDLMSSSPQDERLSSSEAINRPNLSFEIANEDAPPTPLSIIPQTPIGDEPKESFFKRIYRMVTLRKKKSSTPPKLSPVPSQQNVMVLPELPAGDNWPFANNQPQLSLEKGDSEEEEDEDEITELPFKSRHNSSVYNVQQLRPIDDRRRPMSADSALPPRRAMELLKFPSLDENKRNVVAVSKCKKVYLKGLFSVSTTSTLGPAEIMHRLRLAMKEKGVKYTESTKGHFDCRLSLPKTTPNVRSYHTDGVDTLVTGMESTDATLWFECSVVRIPWLFKVHGVRFRRISGHSWLYRDLCSQILELANI